VSRGSVLGVIVCTCAALVASVLLTLVAITGPARIVAAGGLFGFTSLPSALFAAAFWTVFLMTCVAAVLLSRPSGSAFAPAVGGTIVLCVPIAIAVVVPSALVQWSTGLALTPEASSSSTASSTLISVIVGAIIGIIMVVAASRHRRGRDASTRHSHDSEPPRRVEAGRNGETAAAGRPTRTVVTGGRPDVPDSALVHALKNVVTAIDETECGWVVDGIVAHLRVHTATHLPSRPVGYQFQLSNGAYATVSDHTIGKRRALDFSGTRVVDGAWQPLTMLVWPEDVPEDGGWFSWPMDGKTGHRMRRDIGNAVRLSYANRSWHRAPNHVLLDPLAAPEPLDTTAWTA